MRHKSSSPSNRSSPKPSRRPARARSHSWEEPKRSLASCEKEYLKAQIEERHKIQTDVADYWLVLAPCSVCNEGHFQVWRWAGAFFSRYSLPPDFRESDFPSFVKSVDETLSVCSSELIMDLHAALMKTSDPDGGIDLDGSYASVLREYARLRLSVLQKRGSLPILLGKSKAKSGVSIKAAFELGFAVAELRMMNTYEDAIVEGFRLQQGREAALPAAREARLREGRGRRRAVIAEAKELYKSEPQLVRNDLKTARRIEAMRLSSLRKADGTYLGDEAIIKHLRKARREGEL